MTTSTLSVVGQSLPRIDAREKVTGGAGFAVDVRLPGMLWGKVLRSPYPHARILRVDAGRASRLPGVKAVLTPADVPPVPFVLVPPPHGVGDQYILNDKVRFVGEAVAAVAAVSKEIAEEAIDYIEVEVDTETGQVRVLRLVAAHDVGRAINPAIAQAQVEGALHHGIGYALTEGLMLDPEGGQSLNASFADYKLLTSLDMPPIEVLLVESMDPVGPFGAKGVGEPAIANAIYDAVGVRIKELPITPDRVLRALGGRE